MLEGLDQLEGWNRSAGCLKARTDLRADCIAVPGTNRKYTISARQVAAPLHRRGNLCDPIAPPGIVRVPLSIRAPRALELKVPHDRGHRDVRCGVPVNGRRIKTECMREGSPFSAGPLSTLADLEDATSA